MCTPFPTFATRSPIVIRKPSQRSWPARLLQVALTVSAIISFPDPSLKEGKGLVYIECFLGLVSGFCRANQIHAMWFTYHTKHVTLHHFCA